VWRVYGVPLCLYLKCPQRLNPKEQGPGPALCSRSSLTSGGRA
jgi:hypothetical protein